VTRLIEGSPRGRKLFLNVSDRSDAEPITAELLDDQDRPIPGYSAKAGAPITEDGTRPPILWTSSAKGTTPPNKSFAVRIARPDNETARLDAVSVE
jgi:hypothetical protein